LNTPGPAVPSATALPELPALGDLELVLFALVALGLTAFFAVLRSALLHSVPGRVLEKARDDEERGNLRPLLERAESLATSASVFEITCQIFFVYFVFLAARSALDEATGEPQLVGSMGAALVISVPLLVFAGDVLPGMLRGERSDRLLRSVLPAFDWLRRPLAAVIYALDVTRRGTMRLLRVPERPRSVRRIVEGLRDVIEDSDREHELRESEREIIENVVDFHDVDVAEVMTPRTDVAAVEVGEGVGAVIRLIAKSGHTRIPVYEKSLDSIIGVAYAQELVRLLLVDRGQPDLRDLVRPANFVPETKLVSELLAEFRRGEQKMAVVLDEYGGTSGIVTMGDIVAELVGDVRDELGKPEPAPLRHLPDGSIEVAGQMRIGELNEELELQLSEEEDYDTVAGFVLAEFGRFPKRGESFEWDGTEFTVADASDRRVLKVLLRLPEAHKLG